jgi:hypothetical protein
MSFWDSLFGAIFGRRGSTRPSSPPPPPRPPATPPRPPAAPPRPPATPPAPPPATPPAPPPVSPPTPPPGSPPVTPPPAPPVPPPPISTEPPPGFTLDSLRAADATRLSDDALKTTAQTLGIDVNVLKAILRVESAGPGFSGGKLLISFEPFYFSQLTEHRFDASHPAISNSNRAPLGGNQTSRWQKLAEAYALDADGALGATSWGAFQLPGRYFATAGYPSVFAFVQDMAQSEARQLAAFQAYITRASLVDELAARDWAGFAGEFEGGPGAAAYATALANAFAALPPAAADNYLTTLRRQNNDPLTRASFEEVAGRLGCEWEAAAAVAEVESGPLGGFAADGRPVILFERHLFSRKTNSRFDASHPNISNRTPGGYPRTQAERWGQLELAYSLDPEAALQSASYGRFQVLGQNFANLGMANAHEYVSKLAKSEKDQLEAFEGFVRANGLADELQRKDWAGFASRYNGPGYAANQYDTKMANAYARLKSTPIA